jgi:hypothetical protein
MFIMKIQREVERALAAAPTIDLAKGNGVEGLDFDMYGPEVVIVSDDASYQELFAATYASIGKEYDHAVHGNSVRHEGEHATAWRLLGANTLYFGLRYLRLERPTRTFVFKPFLVAEVDWDLTPLEHAAAMAHPVMPSFSDVTQIRALGFDGIHEVAQRAILCNRMGLGDRPIPVPLSYAQHSAPAS